MKLILLPGTDGTGLLFEPFLKHLDPAIEPVVIVYPNDACFSYDDYVAYVLGRLPVDEDFVLLGESFSGRIAFEIGKRALPNMVGIIFVCSFLENPAPRLGWLARLLPMGWGIHHAMPSPVVKRLLLGNDATVSLIDNFKRVVRQVNPEVLLHRIMLITESQPLTGTLHLPTLHLLASGDQLVPARTSESLATQCSLATTRTIAGPHGLLQAEPVECASFVSAQIALWSASTTTDSKIDRA